VLEDVASFFAVSGPAFAELEAMSSLPLLRIPDPAWTSIILFESRGYPRAESATLATGKVASTISMSAITHSERYTMLL